MPSSIRPGDVLADRYRLVDLLTESSGGRFWRAHDKVLERYVALHVLAADDERAPALLEAARQSATVHERRLLRVLDADRTDRLVYVVNEWGSGDSLDIMLANEGPLTPRRAAWLVSEVADAIATGHEAGVAHGRLVPENVLVDHTGAVRLIGFSVEAALFGMGTCRPSADVTSIGGVLYAALTGRWPGSLPSQVPEAPVVQGRVLRPRQVRAGIPRPLDVLCDEVVNPYAAHDGSRLRETFDLATARGIADYLAEFVGDPTGLAEAEAAAGHRDLTETISLPSIADPPPRLGAAVDPSARETDDDASADTADTPATPGATPGATPPAAAPASSTELPTEAGMPIFDDENDDVSWFAARSEPVPPPPPFEEPPERPLFAPDPVDGPVRTPRSPASAAGASYWPWESTGPSTGTGLTPAVEEPEEEVPGRSWMRLAGVIGACLVLLLAIVVAYNLGRGRSPLGALPGEDETTSSPTASSSPLADVIPDVTVTDFDPQGSPPREEYPELAPLAVDGKPGTAWRTATYLQNFGPGGLKDGVGLVLDLGRDYAVEAVDLTFVGTPTSFQIFVTDSAPNGVRGLTAATEGTAEDTRTRAELEQPTTGRFVTLWLTSIPAVEDGFRGEVAEVAVRG